jgi:hypothetical protein
MMAMANMHNHAAKTPSNFKEPYMMTAQTPKALRVATAATKAECTDFNLSRPLECAT